MDERIPYRFHYDGRDAARPGLRTRRVAHVAHRSYWDLVKRLRRTGTAERSTA
ncbi:MAG: hypothetical protein M3198_02575 [Actinomycetota bacterium]|nr:hypothetical protein [Actinomycetota bacterium]